MQTDIRQAIETALRELGLNEVDFVVEHPAEIGHGDYACNAALAAAKAAGQSPRAIAEQLLAKLSGKINEVEKIEIAGPGFLNFYLTRLWLADQTAQINEAGEDWGKNNSWQGKVVIVEYTDPNPFKELHIGHLVPNALGESLARLFMFAGADTKRVTFQGDVGMHVAKAVYGLKINGETAVAGFDASALGKAYAAGSTLFETDEAAAAEIKALNKIIYQRSDEVINELYDYGKKVSLEYFEQVYAVLGSAFDHNFFESVTGLVGQKLVTAHIGDVFEKSDGAVIFKGEDYGLHTRVFINKEGLPTYETKDVGLIQCKEEWSQAVTGKSFDLTITVTGTEQQEYFKVTTKASSLLQPELAGKVELVPNGMLRLSEGKMSSRTGNVVRALDLISDVSAAAITRARDEVFVNNPNLASSVAVAAIKYAILKIAAGKDIVFDLKQSVSFEGDSGPYLQYTYARIQSVLEKAQSSGVAKYPSGQSAMPNDPYQIEKILYRFPEVITEALVERAPHKVVTFLTELASSFNTFYAQEKIADPSDEYASYKVELAKAVGQTLKNGLWVLGITAPERM